jgi:hypothetical protein
VDRPAPLILLVGMHRSGTSLLGSLLPHLGVALPGELIRGDQHNPEGYFERRDVVDLQENLLIALDRFWAGPQGPEPLPRHWRSHPATQGCRLGLRELLQRESGRQAGPWAIKDPRSSVLLPLWRELCRELAIPLQLVLAVRSPEAVVASVMARDERLAGMTWWRAQQLWWHFNAAVLGEPLAPGEAPPVVLHYESWFSDPEAQARTLATALGLPDPEPAQLAAVRAAIRPEHRHQQPLPAGAPPLDRRLQRLHGWLQHQSRLTRALRLQQRPLQPRRPWRQEIAHRLDWIWLLGTPLLPPHGLLAYRRRFLQGEGAGPLVSLAWLARQRPQLTARFRDPLAWYRRCGWRQGVSPHPLLEPRLLWRQLVREQEAVALYRREAGRDDLAVHPCFDPVHYGRQCRDADCVARPTPLEHYLVEGWRLGLAPHPAVDPLWMARRHGLPGEPLTALLLAGGDATDPGHTHPRGTLYGAALADPRCVGRLPPPLVALLQLWHARRLWPADRWLEPSAWQQPLPSFALGAAPQAAPLAAGLQPQPGSLPLPAPPVLASTASWRVRQLLAACPPVTGAPAGPARLHIFQRPDAPLPEPAAVAPADWWLSLAWPEPQRLTAWLQALRRCSVVLDPDPERAGFLQLFGVPARHQPLAPLKLAPGERDTLLLQAQRRLGLPDPRWFDPAPTLVVLGSSGQQQERRWGRLGLSPAAADLLLLPRLPQLVLASLQDVQALQAWLESLLAHGAQVLLLQPLAEGACRPAPGVAVFGPAAEPALLHHWEERCR